MSVIIDKSKLSLSQQLEIVDCLTFKRKEEIKKHRKHRHPPGPPVPFYISEKELIELDPSIVLQRTEYEANNLFRIPFSFSNAFFRKYINEKESKPDSDLIFNGKLRDYQVSIVNRSIQHLKDYCTTTLGLYTGYGKTVVGSYLACHLKKITCIIHPAPTTLGTQWSNVFENLTSAKIWLVAAIGEKKRKKNNDRWHFGTDCPNFIPDIIICLTERWTKIPHMLKMMVGTLILDEAHLLCTPGSVPVILSFSPIYIIQMTATPTRNDELHMMLWSLGGMHIIYTMFDRPFLVMKINTGISLKAAKSLAIKERRANSSQPVDVKDESSWQEMEMDLLQHPIRNKIIISLVRGDKDRHKIAMLTTRKPHVQDMYQIALANGIQSDYMTGTKKDYKNSRFLIGTFSKIGVGFDEANACEDYDGVPMDTAIIAGPVRQKNRLEQGVGRVFRSNEPRIYHLIDKGGPFNEHWDQALSWYRIRNSLIIEYDIEWSSDGKLMFLVQR